MWYSNAAKQVSWPCVSIAIVVKPWRWLIWFDELRGCPFPRGKVRLYRSLKHRGQAIWTLKIRNQVKEFSIQCMGRYKPLGSLISFLSYAPQLSGAKYCFLFFTLKSGIGCFLHSPSSSAITMGGGSICWITVLGAFIHIWRPATDGGCDISCLLIWQEIVSFCKYNKKTCSPASHHTPALHVLLFSN